MMNRNGYTLVEMMTVMGIVAMTAAAAVPSMIARIPAHRSEEAAWQLYMDLQEARGRAVSENLPVEISVNNSSDEYTIWVDANQDGVKETSETVVNDLSNVPTADLYAYPTSVSFTPSGTLDTSFYYFYMRVLVPGAGTKYIYVFPNGHIDPMRIQGT